MPYPLEAFAPDLTQVDTGLVVADVDAPEHAVRVSHGVTLPSHTSPARHFGVTAVCRQNAVCRVTLEIWLSQASVIAILDSVDPNRLSDKADAKRLLHD